MDVRTTTYNGHMTVETTLWNMQFRMLSVLGFHHQHLAWKRLCCMDGFFNNLHAIHRQNISRLEKFRGKYGCAMPARKYGGKLNNVGTRYHEKFLVCVVFVII
jgi:hypothetical protein